MLLGFDFYGLPGLELGVADGRLTDASVPLVFLLLEKGFAQRFADHFAGVVVETRGDFRLHRAFQFRLERDIHAREARKISNPC